MGMAILESLLRRPSALAADCREGRQLHSIARDSLILLAAGGAIFGAVLGTLRGDVQIAYGAIKMPAAFLTTLVLSVPAFYGVSAAYGRPWPLPRLLALVLAASARAALVLVAVSPVLWLAMDLGLGYHLSVLAASLAYGVAGLAALAVLLSGFRGPAALRTAAVFGLILFAVGSQVAWSLRPYFVRPAAESIPFVRAPEGTAVDAVVTSGRSVARFGNQGYRR